MKETGIQKKAYQILLDEEAFDNLEKVSKELDLTVSELINKLALGVTDNSNYTKCIEDLDWSVTCVETVSETTFKVVSPNGKTKYTQTMSSDLLNKKHIRKHIKYAIEELMLENLYNKIKLQEYQMKLAGEEKYLNGIFHLDSCPSL